MRPHVVATKSTCYVAIFEKKTMMKNAKEIHWRFEITIMRHYASLKRDTCKPGVDNANYWLVFMSWSSGNVYPIERQGVYITNL